MPTFKGQVTEEQLNALVAYIKSLSPNAGGMSPGAAPAASTTNQPAANKVAAANPAANSNK